MWHAKYVSCTLHNYAGIKSRNYVQAHLMNLFKSHKILQHGPWPPLPSGSLRRSAKNHKESHDAGTLMPISGKFGSKSRVLNLFIVIHNERPDDINEVIPLINN
jgi:hypothetical protein